MYFNSVKTWSQSTAFFVVVNISNCAKILRHCGEARNTTVIGTQVYFTLFRQRYKHGGHIERDFLSGNEKRVFYFPE